MKQEEVIKECSELLFKLCDEVEHLNCLNFYDINISCEYFFIPLLDEIFDLNLQNANIEQKNMAAIDLCDDEKKIAVQVTSDTSAGKIRNTLVTFCEKEMFKKYERIYFVVITKKKEYKANFDATTKGLFNFSIKDDILTIEHLIKQIRKLPIEKLIKVYKYLKFQIQTVPNSSHVLSSTKALEKIKNDTQNILCENYFDIDDTQFIRKFSQKIETQDIIHISSLSREEGMYCVLNQLHKIKCDVPILVFGDLESWKEAEHILKDCIVIPFFDADEIPAIKGNKTIFISNYDYSGSDSLRLPRRTQSFLRQKLEDNGYKNPYKLISQTNGLFYYIKHSLYEGKIASPEWSSDNNKAILTALLIGKWTESDGDKEIIEKIYNGNYSDFLEYLQQYIGNDKPFIVKHCVSLTNTFELSETFLAFQSLKGKISNDMLHSFIGEAQNVILEYDSLFEEPMDNHYYLTSKSKYSNTIKIGMSRTLALLALYTDIKLSVENCIVAIMSNIKSLQDWAYISQFFNFLCEAAPEIVLSRLESEIQNDTGLIKLCSIENFSRIFSMHYYANVIWGVECLLKCKDYAVRVVHWILSFENKFEAAFPDNNQKEIISQVFCYFYNVTALDVSTKINLAKYSIKKYDFFWKILMEEVSTKTSLWLSDNNFSYRESDDIIQYSHAEIQQILAEYQIILLENISNSPERLLDITNILSNFNNNLFKKAIAQIERDIETCSDSEKEKIKTNLRNIVFRNRMYSDADWAIDEEFISQIESICLSINFKDPAYDFLYLTNSYHFPILHPSSHYEELESERNDILSEEFERFRSLNIELKHYLELISREAFTKIGVGIAKYYSHGAFDEKVFLDIINGTNTIQIAYDYVAELAYNDEKLIYKALKIMWENHCDDTLLAATIRLIPLNENTIPVFDQLPENIAQKLWNRFGAFRFDDNKGIHQYIANKYLRYKNFGCLFLFVTQNVANFTTDELISLLSISLKYIQETNYQLTGNDAYYVNEYIQEIHKKIEGDYSKYEEVARIEITLLKIIDWENMMCFKHLLKFNATYYAEIIAHTYATDWNIPAVPIDEDVFKKYYEIEQKAMFCPAEVNGVINEDILNEWLVTFKECLRKRGQEKWYTTILGKLFSNSPIGYDGYYPHESIRNVIEEEGDDELIHSYVCAIHNKRGVYTVTEGKNELELSLKYKNIKEYLQIMYPKTSKIYFLLSEDYENQSKRERRLAEDGYY